MKIKDLRLEHAKSICNRHIKNSETAYICQTCPLYLNDYSFCGKSFAYLNDKYGNKEINFKEWENNEEKD